MNEEDCIPYEFYWIDVGYGDLEVGQFFGVSWRICGSDEIYLYNTNERPTFSSYEQFHKIVSHIERPTNAQSN